MEKLNQTALPKAQSALINILKKYFNIMPDKEDENDTIKNISAGVSFHGATLWVLVFAIFIASLGLNVNSTAVIIGAMLISPLMGPIIGMGLSVGINDFELLKRSAKNYIVATVISVITATVYFLLTPLDEAQSELLARTSPTLYDVLIALFGGAAGIVALATKGKGNVLPGVAIATALMPPLCTAGFGIATGNIYYFLGAFYLFFINTVFISLATYLGVRMMKFKQKQFINKERYIKVKRYIIIVVIITMVPAFFMTYNIIKNSIFESNVRNFISNELENPGTQVITYDVNKDSMFLRVVAIGKELTDSSITKAEKEMSNYKLFNYKLKVVQGAESDSTIILNNSLKNIKTSSENYAAMFNEETKKAARLQEALNEYSRYEEITPELAKEINALFPQTANLSLSIATESSTDSLAIKKYVIAIIGTKSHSQISGTEKEKMSKWLRTRLGIDTIRLIINK